MSRRVITVDDVVAEVKRHHLHPGWMSSRSHYGYGTWGVTCRNHHDNPDTDCEFSEWGFPTKEAAATAWYRHVAEAVVSIVSGNEIGEDEE